MIRSATLEDSPAIASIYNWYIEHSVITFEETPVEPGDMAQRMVVADATRPWLVLEVEGSVQGFAYAARWKDRSAYRNTRETSIYLHHEHSGRGLGQQLYERLIADLRENSVHTLIAGITLPNPGSISLHERLGFSHVGNFREVGFKFGEYLDVGYWQLELA